jgi:hypothetical protein
VDKPPILPLSPPFGQIITCAFRICQNGGDVGKPWAIAIYVNFFQTPHIGDAGSRMFLANAVIF